MEVPENRKSAEMVGEFGVSGRPGPGIGYYFNRKNLYVGVHIPYYL